MKLPFHIKTLGIPLQFSPRLFFKIVAAFICFTIIGTISHELGHYLVAKVLGFEASIHYGSISLDSG